MKRTLLFIVSVLLCNTLFGQETNSIDYNQMMKRKEFQSIVTHITERFKDYKERNSELYYIRALAYASMGNHIYSIADCTSAIEYNADNTKAYYLRGKSKFEVNDPTYINDMQLGGTEGIKFLQSHNIDIKSSTVYTPDFLSDVDVDIPLSKNKNSNTFALIISNESYSESNISDVDYAKNDGETFRQYCIKTLGIPNSNIHYRVDATKNQMRSEIKWLQSIDHAFKGDANFIVYYSGHGMPDEKSRKSYLLPSDGIANDAESAYSLESFYSQLGSLSAGSIVVFLDACFSGAIRSGDMLLASKAVAIKPIEEQLTGNVVVFSASRGDETAYPYYEKGHGLFTYFLLKKLKETKGKVSMADLSDYVISSVSKVSVLVNNKSQTPTIKTSSSIKTNWKDLKLK